MTDRTVAERLLAHAVELARQSVAAEGGPFGAVIADVAGHIVAEGQNRVTLQCDPTAHAEVAAIRAACRARADHRLVGFRLYSSCEPCPMCLAAAWWARLDGVWFASSRTAAATAGFDDAALWQAIAAGDTRPQLPLHQLTVASGGTEFEDWAALATRVAY